MSGINATALTSIMVLLAVTLFWMQTGMPVADLGVGVDLPRVNTPHPMPGAARDGAVVISIFRDGTIHLGDDQIVSEELPAKIRESLSHGGERKVYIKADARVYYRTVRGVLDDVRSAGVENVGLLADQRIPGSSVRR